MGIKLQLQHYPFHPYSLRGSILILLLTFPTLSISLSTSWILCILYALSSLISPSQTIVHTSTEFYINKENNKFLSITHLSH